MNLFSGIFVDLIHPDLVQEFLSANNLSNYTKTDIEKLNMKRGLGNGLVLSEDKEWKMKRKVLNTVFNFDFIKSLAPKIAKICDKTLNSLEKNTSDRTVSYNVHDYSSELASCVMLQCFFGKDMENEKIEGVSIPIFVQNLMGDISSETTDLPYIIFGVKFFNLGIRKKDRDINRRLKLYKSWGKQLVNERVEEIKKRIEEGDK